MQIHQPQPVPLGSLRRGQRAEVVHLSPHLVRSALKHDELERRLIEMGLVEGALIEVLHEGFPRRDPIAVRVMDHLVALRRTEANAVYVRLHPGVLKHG